MPNYYIGVDLAGQPYIAHKKDTKYVAKIETPSGTRYFYSTEAYQAYLQDQRRQQASAYGAFNRARNAGKLQYGGDKVRVTSGKGHKLRAIRNTDGSLTSDGEKMFGRIKDTGSVSDELGRGSGYHEWGTYATMYGSNAFKKRSGYKKRVV